MVVIMRRFILLATALLGVLPPVYGQALSHAPEVDKDAVLRTGDLVQHITGIQSDEATAFGQIMGPPALDNDKFVISIISRTGCAPCAQLKADWEKSEKLLAFAKPSDKANSWATFKIYMAGDKSHDWFTNKIKIEGYPTIIVQPPLSGIYGDKTTVIMQGTGYYGPDKTAEAIRSSIRKYVDKLSQKNALYVHAGPPKVSSGGGIQSAEHPTYGVEGAPFQPVTPNSPAPTVTPTKVPALVIPNEVNPDAQPTPAPDATPPTTPKEPESVLAKGEVFNVVIDPNEVWADSSGPVKRLFERLKKLDPTIQPRQITPDQAAKEFPSVDTKTTPVIVTQGGKLKGVLSKTVLDQLLANEPWYAFLAPILTSLSSVLPGWLGWTLVAGGIAFKVVKARREAKAKAEVK
ncbi:MAG: hypothetical protein QM811_06930 [Pirellulales bacterium]